MSQKLITILGAFIAETARSINDNFTELFARPSGGAPGGSDTQVQFNDAGSFGGDAGLTYDKAAQTVTLNGQTALTSVSDTANDGEPLLVLLPKSNGQGNGESALAITSAFTNSDSWTGLWISSNGEIFTSDNGGSGSAGINITAGGPLSLNGGSVVIGGAALSMPGLPTADPHVANKLWSNAGVLTVSAG